MTHRTDPKFWGCYFAPPVAVQAQADRAVELLQDNPSHRSLRFKQVGRYWSARVGLHYRVLATKIESTYVWFWIGHHSEYDQFLRK